MYSLELGMMSEVLSVICKLAWDGMPMAIVTHEIAFAPDVANRIRSHVCRIASPDYDLYATHAGIEIFCEKHLLPREARQNVLLVVEELIGVHRNELQESPLELTVAYSEKSGALEVICERGGKWDHPLENTNLPDQFGVNIIKGLADSVEYTSGNGKCRLTVRLAGSTQVSSFR